MKHASYKKPSNKRTNINNSIYQKDTPQLTDWKFEVIPKSQTFVWAPKTLFGPPNFDIFNILVAQKEIFGLQGFKNEFRALLWQEIRYTGRLND